MATTLTFSVVTCGSQEKILILFSEKPEQHLQKTDILFPSRPNQVSRSQDTPLSIYSQRNSKNVTRFFSTFFGLFHRSGLMSLILKVLRRYLSRKKKIGLLRLGISRESVIVGVLLHNWQVYGKAIHKSLPPKDPSRPNQIGSSDTTPSMTTPTIVMFAR